MAQVAAGPSQHSARAWSSKQARFGPRWVGQLFPRNDLFVGPCVSNIPGGGTRMSQYLLVGAVAEDHTGRGASRWFARRPFLTLFRLNPQRKVLDDVRMRRCLSDLLARRPLPLIHRSMKHSFFFPLPICLFFLALLVLAALPSFPCRHLISPSHHLLHTSPHRHVFKGVVQVRGEAAVDVPCHEGSGGVRAPWCPEWHHPSS